MAKKQYTCEICGTLHNTLRLAHKCEREHKRIHLDLDYIKALVWGDSEALAHSMNLTRWSFRRRFITGEVDATQDEVNTLAKLLDVDPDTLIK